MSLGLILTVLQILQLHLILLIKLLFLLLATQLILLFLVLERLHGGLSPLLHLSFHGHHLLLEGVDFTLSGFSHLLDLFLILGIQVLGFLVNARLSSDHSSVLLLLELRLHALFVELTGHLSDNLLDLGLLGGVLGQISLFLGLLRLVLQVLDLSLRLCVLLGGLLSLLVVSLGFRFARFGLRILLFLLSFLLGFVFLLLFLFLFLLLFLLLFLFRTRLCDSRWLSILSQLSH